MLRKHEREKNIKPKGFFIEAGAGDGEVISNSLYFELKYEVKFLANLSVKSQLFIISMFNDTKLAHANYHAYLI